MKIELITGGKMPQRMTKGAVGFDVFARNVELECVQGFGSGYTENGEQVHSFPMKAIAAKIHLGFKIDCNETHQIIDDLQETHEGALIANWTAQMNFAAMLVPRSGWGAKYGFRLKNTVGIIDPDYRGEVIMVAEFDECPPELLAFANSECNGCNPNCNTCSSRSRYVMQPRVGQMLLVPAYVGELPVVDQLEETERGAGGFGSTDK